MEDQLCLVCKINKRMDLVGQIGILELVCRVDMVLNLICNLHLEAVVR